MKILEVTVEGYQSHVQRSLSTHDTKPGRQR